MATDEKIFEEALDVISDGQDEMIEIKKIAYDKRTGQISIKIPKSLALKKSINENTEFEIIVNPKPETFERIKNSKFILCIKEDENDKGEKRT
jgi:hypothetical protein